MKDNFMFLDSMGISNTHLVRSNKMQIKNYTDVTLLQHPRLPPSFLNFLI